MNTVLGEWNVFKAAVIPADAPKVQVSEMQKAFCAGAIAILALTGELADNLPEEEAAQKLGEIHEELMIFATRVALQGLNLESQ